jgi:hypothetical protein
VKDVVTRSISGHLTQSMQEHYSTVASAEQREAMGKVIKLAGFGGDRPASGDRSGDREEEMKKAGYSSSSNPAWFRLLTLWGVQDSDLRLPPCEAL